MVEGVRVRVGPHYSGVRPKGCPHKFHHIAEQTVIGSARIVCLCFFNMLGVINNCAKFQQVIITAPFSMESL